MRDLVVIPTYREAFAMPVIEIGFYCSILFNWITLGDMVPFLTLKNEMHQCC